MFFKLTGQQWLEKVIDWSLYAFIALFPFVSYNGFLFYGTTSRAVNLFVFIEMLALCLGVALLFRRNDFQIAKSPITLALLLLLATSFISGFFGVDPHTSFWSKATRMTGLFYFLHLGVFYLFLLNLFKNEGKLRNFLNIFVVGAGLFSVGALLSKDGFGLLFKSWTLPGFTIGNSSFAAMYIYSAFMASVYLVLSNEKLKGKWWKYFIPLILLINPYFINISFWSGGVNVFENPLGILGEAQASSFVGFFSIFVLIAISLVARLRAEALKRKILFGSIFTGIIIAILSVYSLFSSSGYLRQAYLKSASSARPIVWELSMQSIAERPVLGWGTDNFDRSFEKNYNNSLLENKNGAEPWFDRAHNIFIDQAVDTGYFGLFIYLLVYASAFGSMVYVVLRSKEKNQQIFAMILGVYFVGHLMELQTGFDTTISYPAVMVMFALASTVFYRAYRAENKEKSFYTVPKVLQYGMGVVAILGSLYFFIVGTLPIIRAGIANIKIHSIGRSEERLSLYPVLFGSPVDRATHLWKTVNDFQRGISLKPQVLEDPVKVRGLAEELAIMTEEYRKYANANPNDYRVRLSLGGVYIYERLLEVNHLDYAHQVLDDAIKLNPEIPTAYWMKAVAYLYQREFALAREWAKRGYDLNPNIEQSKKIIDYIEESIKTFPNIKLFTFSQV